MCETPPRSPTIVGIAVETIVWSSAAISIPASSAEKMMLIRRRVSTMTGAAVSEVGACMEELLGRTTTPRVREVGGVQFSAGQPGGDGVPRLVDQAGERGGEVAGEPALEGGAHPCRGHAGEQGGQHGVVHPGAGALVDRGGQ